MYFKKRSIEFSDQQLAHLREQLLQQMTTNVAQRLKDSLHNLLRAELEQEAQQQVKPLQERPTANTQEGKLQIENSLVARSWAAFDNRENIQPIAPEEKTYSIFKHPDIGQRLLILGEPGAGKTTELLMVAQRLVGEAVENEKQQIPLLFELSTWEADTSILLWVAQQLKRAYGVSKEIAKSLATQLIEQEQILLLLDGLDELEEEYQSAYIEALDKFLEQHANLAAIVCCRKEVYAQNDAQLQQFNGAVYLQTVETEKIQQYLKDLGQESLWQNIQTNPKLLELAKSPLFLNMLVIAHDGQLIDGQLITDKQSLFNVYIQKRLHNPTHQDTDQPKNNSSRQTTLHYLGWLAGQLHKRKEPEFLIENLQPDWLETKLQRLIYRLSVGLSVGLSIGLTGGPSLGPSYGRIGELVYGLILGLSYGLITGLTKIRPQEDPLKWSRKGLIWGLSAGLIGGLSFGSFFGLNIGLLSGLNFGLFFGLCSGLNFGRTNEAIQQQHVPNQGIGISLQKGLTFMLTFMLSCGMNIGFGGGLSEQLRYGLCFGLIFGLNFGLDSAIQHFILRVYLTKSNVMPWNYALFLEQAAHYRFIQRTGGRYRFIHHLLKEHFAQMTPQQQAMLAQNGDL